MKKLLILTLFLIFYFLFFIFDIVYATPTPTETKKSSLKKQATASSDMINELKERIASRVAQLKLVERRGIIGTVTDISNTQITLADSLDNTRFIDVDELTKFSSSSEKESFGISDIAKGGTISVLGLYNKQSQRILARFVEVVTLPRVLNGAVTSIDEDDFTVKIVLDTNEVYTIDIEKITKTLSHAKGVGLTRSGFSKIKQGQHVIVIGFPDRKEKNKLTASRFLLFPDVPKNPKINIPQNVLLPQDSAISSTDSSKKATPITR